MLIIQYSIYELRSNGTYSVTMPCEGVPGGTHHGGAKLGGILGVELALGSRPSRPLPLSGGPALSGISSSQRYVLVAAQIVQVKTGRPASEERSQWPLWGPNQGAKKIGGGIAPLLAVDNDGWLRSTSLGRCPGRAVPGWLPCWAARPAAAWGPGRRGANRRRS